jgi:N-methylhydantoinase A
MLLGVDVGGTFTDAVLVQPDGTVFTAKAPTTPSEQHSGVMAAVQAVLASAEVRAEQVERFAHGMTVATNALLEGRVARTALIATEGFTDIVELGRQARVSLYRLCDTAPAPLAPADMRFAAPERTGPDGVLRALEPAPCEELLEHLTTAAPQAVAVVLLHSYAHPEHERKLGELIAQRLPEAHISLSHEVVGTFREYERATTTEIDAALSPLLTSYLHHLSARTEEYGLPAVQVMQSSGGLTDARRASQHAALTVLSGPAGGVGGALLLSQASGVHDVLCFDMGGTSCDVCVIESNNVTETAARTVAGRPLALPALDIHTVGAGGGSIAWRDAGGAMRVGPESAGATPGPACYGLGGTRATVTDANLVLGRLPLDQPLAGGVKLDLQAAQRTVGQLARDLHLEPLACAEGIVRVAETEMLRALAVMTVERGIDPRHFALMAFGGAGGLHAAALASELGIERVLCPRACGVLSALGLAAAAARRDTSSTVMLSGDTFTETNIARELSHMVERTTSELSQPPSRIVVRYELRYRGQSFELTIREELTPGDLHPSRELTPGNLFGDHPSRLRNAFEQAHERRYGYRDPHAEVELVNMRVSAIGAQPALRLKGATAHPPARTTTRIVFDGMPVEAELWQGELPTGTRVEGPALCALPESTLLLPPGWSGMVDDYGTVVLERETTPAQARAEESHGDAQGTNPAGWR